MVSLCSVPVWTTERLGKSRVDGVQETGDRLDLKAPES